MVNRSRREGKSRVLHEEKISFVGRKNVTFSGRWDRATHHWRVALLLMVYILAPDSSLPTHTHTHEYVMH